MMKQNDYMNIPKEKFEFVGRGEKIFDRKLETKPIGYFKDAFIRFRKNKSSVVAAIIILILVLYAIIAPIFSPFTVDDRDPYYATILPKNRLLAQYGIWDGSTQKQEAIGGYHLALALGQESGTPVILGDVEEVLLGDDEDEFDDEFEDDEDEDFEDEEFYEMECPFCGETIEFDASIDPEHLTCPACHKEISLEIECPEADTEEN